MEIIFMMQIVLLMIPEEGLSFSQVSAWKKKALERFEIRMQKQS